MENKYKTIFNPFFKLGIQKVVDTDELAEKNHKHLIADVQGLTTILTNLSNNQTVNISGGYIAE